MTSDDHPTQPLTDANERILNRDLLWAPGTDTITDAQMNAIRTRHASAAQPIPSKTALGYDHLMAHADRAALLAEVDRLRAILGYVEVPDDQAEENDIDRLQVMLRTRTAQRDKLEAENSELLRKVEEQYRHRAENARLRAEIVAARKVLFDDAFEGHAQRYRALARTLGETDE